METKRSQWLVAGISVLVGTLGVAHAALTHAQACQPGKNKAVGKYAACRQQAAAKFLAALDQELAKCALKFQSTYNDQVSQVRAVRGGV